jgi:hydroxyacylglutathione hydrolase
VRKFAALPDYVQIWPGHGAGSACGKSLGSMPQSTVGYEKLFNWAFGEMSESDFIARALDDQPFPPRYFAEMKKLNRDAGDRPKSKAAKVLGFAELEDLLKKKATVVDTRAAQKFAAGHIPGTFNIPLGKSFLNWSGALVPANRDFYILTDRDGDDAVAEIHAELCKIGLTRVRGVFSADAVHEWQTNRGNLEQVRQVDAAALNGDRTEAIQIIDVRNPDEWSEGHLPGARHIPLAALPERLGELDVSVPIVVQCQGGGRSSIAASFLQSKGMTNVSNLAGGYQAWLAQARETDSEKSASRPRRKRKS